MAQDIGSKSANTPTFEPSSRPQKSAELDALLRTARVSPEPLTQWDSLEALAAQEQFLDDVASLYRDIIDADLPNDVWSDLAHRANRFLDEWFGDEPDLRRNLLGRIIERSPTSIWAFDELADLLTTAERWDELLELYDRRLAVTPDRTQRIRLLDDAAHLAKDFALQPTRAVDFMQMRLGLEPENHNLATTIERLLERAGRWNDLVELWRGRNEFVSGTDARNLRLRIARVYLDHLNDPQAALEELRIVLDESPGHEEACGVLERVLAWPEATGPTRKAALDLARANYESANRPQAVIDAIETALPLLDDDNRYPLMREVANRLSVLGNDASAIDHYARLLHHDPADADARQQMRTLARRAQLPGKHVGGLLAAAEVAQPSQSASLFLEAADVTRSALEDSDRAGLLYRRVLELAEVDPIAARAAAHQLNDLLRAPGDAPERLKVLEALAELETATEMQRQLLGEAGKLARELGDVDRALVAYDRRLQRDPTDTVALDAKVDILHDARRWGPLVEALRTRTSQQRSDEQRRADLIRIALLQANELDLPTEAIETWTAVRSMFGDHPTATRALDRLLSQTERFGELAPVLRDAASSGRQYHAELLSRLGQVCHQHLDQPDVATTYFAQALTIDPTLAAARDGLHALTQTRSCARAATLALATAYQHEKEWDPWLDLVDLRVDVALDERERVVVLKSAAERFETHRGDLEQALRCTVQALKADPTDPTLEESLLRIAQLVQDWTTAAEALSEAARGCSSPRRAAALHRAEGRLREQQLQDPARAVLAYEQAARHVPDDIDTLRAMIRTSAQAGTWPQAAGALVGICQTRELVDQDVLRDLGQAAASLGQWTELLSELEALIAQTPLPPPIARELTMVCARWHQDERHDLEAAQQAAQKAVGLDPHHREAAELLVSIQRQRPQTRLGKQPELARALIHLATLADLDLDPLVEAAEIATTNDEDLEWTRACVTELYRRAAGLFRRHETPKGSHDAASATRWALETAVKLDLAAEHPHDATARWLAAAELPFAREQQLADRLEAARLLSTHGSVDQAIDLFRRVLEERASDITLIQELATLCEREQRWLELLAMRTRELELTRDTDARLALRLDLARLTGMVERSGGRVESLLRNLEDAPGHRVTIEALSEVLRDRGELRRLADVLSTQAQQLEETSPERAAELWWDVTKLAEHELEDVKRALLALTRVVQLDPSHDALDGLARLHLREDAPDHAADVLRRRLETTAEDKRPPVLLRLARAQIAAGLELDAIETLQQAFDEAPRNAEARKHLIRLQRQHQQWDALATTLSRAAVLLTDPAMVESYATEASTLFDDVLGQPERGIDVLTRAVDLNAELRPLKRRLATALVAGGELEAARALVTTLIADFGRRRPPERAIDHIQLAKIARAQGDVEFALEQLEQAASIDRVNPTAWQQLAELARENGQFDRAERAYRALLMQARRRGRDAESSSDGVGPATVLFELSDIAGQRGDTVQAQELMESVLEAIVADDREGPPLQAVLRERQAFAPLRRVLETRLNQRRDPRAQATMLAELADLQERDATTRAEALIQWFAAVDADPSTPDYHERARALAIEIGRLNEYVERVRERLDNARRTSDVYIRCELLLRLAEAAAEANDDAEATDLLQQAESLGVREVDVWRSAAHIAGRRGDTETQTHYLERLATYGEGASETRADALYRLAEVQLAHADTEATGLETLRTALATDPKHVRAVQLLRRATVDDPSLDMLHLFEDVAREAGDRHALLEALERKAGRASTGASDMREAVDLARELGEDARAEALMRRAIDRATEELDGLGGVIWAAVGLCDLFLARGDIPAAAEQLIAATEAAPELEGLLPSAAGLLAAVRGQPEFDAGPAIAVYEALRERDATQRAIWEPLADLYRQTNDLDPLARLVEETLDSVDGDEERQTLRLQLAQSLAQTSDRVDDAIGMLRAILLEAPDHAPAHALLRSLLEQNHRDTELLELLTQQFMVAQDRGEPAAIVDAAQQLAARQDRADARSTLTNALTWAPTDAKLLQAILALTDNDDIDAQRDLLRRLLATQSGDDAASTALHLAALCRDAEDEDGEREALLSGEQRAPGHDRLHTALKALYERHDDIDGLTGYLLEQARSSEDSTLRAALITEAATLVAERLDQPSRVVSLLQEAYQHHPSAQIATNLVEALERAGNIEDALALLTEQLADESRPATERVPLYRRRSTLRAHHGDTDGALEDLEAGHRLDPTMLTEVIEAMEAARQAAYDAEQEEREQALVTRLADLYIEAEQPDTARSLLSDWVARFRKDTEALHRLLKLETQAEAWASVAKICGRLVAIESGPAQVEAALSLSQACMHLGTLEDARPGLEHARRKQPDNPEIRRELIAIYESIGANLDLARLLDAEAEALVDREDERIDTLERAARLYLAHGDDEGARIDVAHLLALRPHHRWAALTSIDLHLRAGDIDTAEQTLERLSETIADDKSTEKAEIVHRRAMIAGHRGDRDEQLTLLQQAFNLDKSNGYIAADLANLAELTESWDLAIRVLRTITLLDGESPMSRAEAFLRQAKIAEHRGDRQRALLWARKAKHEAPDDSSIAAFLIAMGD